MTAVRIGQQGSEAVGRSGFESQPSPTFFNLNITTENRDTPLLILNIFRYQKFSETQKGSPTKFFGTLRQKKLTKSLDIPSLPHPLYP